MCHTGRKLQFNSSPKVLYSLKIKKGRKCFTWKSSLKHFCLYMKLNKSESYLCSCHHNEDKQNTCPSGPALSTAQQHRRQLLQPSTYLLPILLNVCPYRILDILKKSKIRILQNIKTYSWQLALFAVFLLLLSYRRR